ncbi:hypothetical protein [Trinickia symbiotica]|uniref:hypothetical protein n=1 Tax=Trinickia symbiotica TaxID=863227 RepID=UPI002158CCEB|nr:hypothetical protein [Trinickia symbiotica]
MVGTHFRCTGNFNQRKSCSSPDQAGIWGYARRFRHAHALIAGEIDAPGLGRTISLYGAMPERPFAEYQRQTMQWLFPHLMEAWSINQALHAEKIRIEPDERQWTVAMADPAGFLHFVEPDAWPLLEAEWPGMPTHRLPEHAIHVLLERSGRRFDGTQIVVTTVVAGRLLFLKIRSRVAADSLTPRERAIAAEIADGLHTRRSPAGLPCRPRPCVTRSSRSTSGSTYATTRNWWRNSGRRAASSGHHSCGGNSTWKKCPASTHRAACAGTTP